MDYTNLSKKISYILRHHPEKYNIQLDENGFVEIEKVLYAINIKKEFKREIDVNDILYIIEMSDKQRFEILDNKIRACYGHSFSNVIIYEEKKPPDVLYHGTTNKAVGSIMKNGLMTMKRQYVHLIENVEMAILIGKRKDYNPVVLKINAKKAYEDGIKFYLGNENIWLTDNLPTQYIEILET